MNFTEQDLAELFGKVTNASGTGKNNSVTSDAAKIAGTAAAVGGPVGATVGAVGVGLAGIYDTLKNVFSSPSPDWEQTNQLAVPMATETARTIIAGVGSDKVPKIITLYAESLKNYIRNSPHNPTQTQNFIAAIDREVIGGNVRVDAFPFSSLDEIRLAWCIWLHVHWLFGGVSRDEIQNRTAYAKLQASMVATLEQAIYAGSGVKLQPKVNPNTGEETLPEKESPASMFSWPYMSIVLIGVAAGLLYFATRGKP